MKEIKILNAEINAIFPTPIYISKINRNFSIEELNLIEKIKQDTFRNEGNETSYNNKVLEEKIFFSLKKELEEHVLNYFNKVINSSNSITPYITQSWLNFTKKDEFHHIHDHANSMISGVLYINADINYDKIKFYKQQYQQIYPEIKEFNFFNSDVWFFPVESKQIIIFPSSLSHSVEIKKGTNTRISLAFNVFIKGIIGNSKNLTELVL
jgi:uncharacterized protein (TIGR02466 family)